ncbi:GntR family transcriptional regulator [Streptomyces rimosus]|uniref:GntR family transcriptional regulator n=1 Tax=Streptomyces rimosus TaxID=1927 RepID=UPI0004C8D319|nr:GntR family transcriptional regulator [Streptomyces rimosus]
MPDLSHLTPLPPKAATDDRHALRERIHSALAEALVNGTLAPGQEYEEARLAARLGAPLAPLREALLQLAAQRLVEYAEPETVRVTTDDATTRRHTAAVLHGLYRTALLTAPWPLAEDALDGLRNSADAYARAAARRNAVEAAAAERALWSVFVHACRNRPLYDAVTQLASVWQRAQHLEIPLPADEPGDVWSGLLAACAAGDRQRALRCVDDYWSRAGGMTGM